MKNRFLVLAPLLVASLTAFARAGEAYQSATAMRVQKQQADTPMAGDNPTDAPLRPDVYWYDVSLKVDCVIYVARYASSFDQSPPFFTVDRQVDVRVEKHVLYAHTLGANDTKLSILRREVDSAGSCSRH
jgi:hypothetical protein